MYMNIASLLITAQLSSAQLSSTPRQRLRHDDANRDSTITTTSDANQGTHGWDYARHLEELSSNSMSLSMANLGAASTAYSHKPRSSKSAKDPFLEDRFGPGPYLTADEIAKAFDKEDRAFIETWGLQNLKEGFSPPIVDVFTTIGRIDISLEQAETLCASRCHNNPDCKAVMILGDTRSLYKVDYSCIFFNPDLGGGAYITRGLGTEFKNDFVIYTKKDEDTAFPSFDDVACNINALTVENDIFCALYCASLGDSNETCLEDICIRVTSDFKNYILPAVTCLGQTAAFAVLSAGGNETEANSAFGAVIGGCLDCLTRIEEGAAARFCVDGAKNFISGKECKDKCYLVPNFSFNSNTTDSVTIDLTECKDKLQVSGLCFSGAFLVKPSDGPSRGGQVNRDNNTIGFACPE